jgi:HEAT repeat protein
VRFRSVEAFKYLDFSTAEPDAVAPIVPALMKALSDPEREVRYVATGALARSLSLARGSKRGKEVEKDAAGLLILTLEDKFADVRVGAASALATIGPVNPQVVPLLGRMLKSADPCERGGGVEALGGIADNPHGPLDQEESARLRKEILQTLRGMVNDPENYVRERVVTALRNIVSGLDRLSDQKERKSLTSGVTQTLLGMINDSDSDVRYSVTVYLEEIGPEVEGVIPALIKLTKDPASGVRYQAASSLGTFQTGRDRIIPALISMLKVKNEYSEVIESALRSLESMGKEARSAAPVVRKLLKSKNPRTREYAGYALEEIDPVRRAKTAGKKAKQ